MVTAAIPSRLAPGRTTETTCSARAVDGGVRGGLVGAMWGALLGSHRARSRPMSATLAAIDVAGLMAIYCGKVLPFLPAR
jgi:hypothetical protein